MGLTTITVAIEAQTAAETWTNIWADVRRSSVIKWNTGIRDLLPTSRCASPGTLHFELDNSESNSDESLGYYQPGHTNCLTGWQTGIPIRMTLTRGEVSKVKFRGRIRRLTPILGKKGPRSVQVECTDWWEEAALEKCDLYAILEDTATGACVDAVVTEMAEQPFDTDYDVGDSTYPYALDDLKDERSSASSALSKLAMSEFGWIFTKGDGTLVFQERSARLSGTTAAEFSDDATDVAAGMIPIDLLEASIDGSQVFNDIRITFYPREIADSPETLYLMQNAMQVPAGESRTVTCRFTDPDNRDVRVSALSIETPEEDTDWTFSSTPAGAGDMNDDLTITAVFGANSAEILFENGAATAGYLSLFKIRGTIIRAYEPIIFRIVDQTSIDAYGLKTLQFTMPYMDDYLTVMDIGTSLLADWKDPKLRIKKMGFNMTKSATAADAGITLEPGSKIELTESVADLDSAEFVINGMEYEIHNGIIPSILCRAYIEPSDEAAYWYIGIEGMSEIGETTWVGA